MCRTKEINAGKCATCRSYDPRDYIITAEDVRTFFDQYPKTKEGARDLLYRLGVRFRRNGTVSRVISL